MPVLGDQPLNTRPQLLGSERAGIGESFHEYRWHQGRLVPDQPCEKAAIRVLIDIVLERG